LRRSYYQCGKNHKFYARLGGFAIHKKELEACLIRNLAVALAKISA
jgi:hypothetical protein